MKIRRRTEIVVETQEAVVVSRAGRDDVAWCSGCGKKVRMLTVDEAMALTGASPREIHRRLEAGEVHFTEITEGFVLMCMNSLDHFRETAEGSCSHA